MHASRSRLPSRLQPLLKWAGGKRQLLPALGGHYPPAFGRYIEPFFGSGAVFFDLIGSGRLDGRPARLTDINPDLIGCYTSVRDDTHGVIAALERLAREHAIGGDACYYEVRDQRFNPVRAALRSQLSDVELAARYTPELAAMLVFLNRTGFNGLFRLNREGAFNVPVGRYARPKICDADLLRRVAAAFRRDEVTLACVPFDHAIAEAGPRDFVYCDPPYAPLTRTACFAHYTAGGFGAFDQARLQRAVLDACRRGAFVVVSNSSAQEVLDLYDTRDAQRVGLKVSRVPARRAINSRATARGPVDELIISNVHTATGIGRGKLRMAKATTATGSRRLRTA